VWKKFSRPRFFITETTEASRFFEKQVLPTVIVDVFTAPRRNTFTEF